MIMIMNPLHNGQMTVPRRLRTEISPGPSRWIGRTSRRGMIEPLENGDMPVPRGLHGRSCIDRTAMKDGPFQDGQMPRGRCRGRHSRVPFRMQRATEVLQTLPVAAARGDGAKDGRVVLGRQFHPTEAGERNGGGAPIRAGIGIDAAIERLVLLVDGTNETILSVAEKWNDLLHE